MTVAEASSRNTLQTVERALAVLEVLAANPHGVTPKQLTTRLSLNLSTVYHLLRTLSHSGYAVQSPNTHLFQLGPRTAVLHQGWTESLRVAPQLVSFLRALSQATDACTQLVQWEGDQVVMAAGIDSKSAPWPMSSYVGFKGAAHAMACGKVLLAWASTQQLKAYFTRSELRRYTHGTLTDPDVLRRDLAQIRTAGYALDQEEFLPGYCCVAAPIFSSDGAVRESFAVVVVVERFESERSRLVAATLDISRSASYAHGADPRSFADKA
jgi:IclR family transcriptional regulator, acetate operon repressor